MAACLGLLDNLSNFIFTFSFIGQITPEYLVTIIFLVLYFLLLCYTSKYQKLFGFLPFWLKNIFLSIFVQETVLISASSQLCLQCLCVTLTFDNIPRYFLGSSYNNDVIPLLEITKFDLAKSNQLHYFIGCTGHNFCSCLTIAAMYLCRQLLIKDW